MGNYVFIRGTGEKMFESMPIYARIGMHLLFYGKEQIKLLHWKTVEEHLRDMTIKVSISACSAFAYSLTNRL